MADAGIALVLLVVIAAVYVQVGGFDFLNFDDDVYVAANPSVRQGLTAAGIARAFTGVHSASWHPLATISHMADCSLFGMWAGGPHLVNVLLHLLNTLILFAVLTVMTGARWRSAFVAAMFGLHPLHVESVAWISERKDVLSTFFWMLTVVTYAYYVESPTNRRYAAVAAMYGLALLSKPMVITLPVILLLLDIWPLGRLADAAAQGRSEYSKRWRALIREKLLLFGLSGVLCVVTIAVQAYAGAMVPLQALPMRIRLANVPIAYMRYIGKMLWPTGLAILYPYEFQWPLWEVIGASIVLLAVTFGVIRVGPRHRYATVGWLWFLVGLLPVIGVFQAGVQAIADRFTYVPLIGLFILVAWGGYALAVRWRYGPRVLAAVALMVVAASVPVTWVQAGYWRNSYSIFAHALAVTKDNAVAHEYLGKALLADGRVDEAAPHFEEQVRLLPFVPEAHLRLAIIQTQLGHADAAAAQIAEARRLLPPDAAEEYYNMANNRVREEKFAEASTHYREALALNPDWPEAHHNLGIALASQGKPAEALAEYAEALRLRPDFAQVYVSRGLVLADQGKTEEAITAYQAAIQLRPTFAAAYRNAGIALAQLGRYGEAIAHLEDAVRLDPEDADTRAQLELMHAGRR